MQFKHKDVNIVIESITRDPPRPKNCMACGSPENVLYISGMPICKKCFSAESEK